MNVFTSTMEEEIVASSRPSSLLDVSQIEESEQTALATPQRLLMRVLTAGVLSHTESRTPFKGLLATLLHCKVCLRKVRGN